MSSFIQKNICKFLLPSSNSLSNKSAKIEYCKVISRSNSKGKGGAAKPEEFPVTIIGAAGGIGQIISYGLKFNPLIKELRLYDTAKHMPGVALDLSHITSKTQVQVYCKKEDLYEALECTKVVVIAAGTPRKPGQDRHSLLKANAKVLDDVIPVIAKASKNASIVIVTNPVNSLVPYASIVMEKNGICNTQRLFGVSYVDLIRAKMTLASQMCIPFEQVNVPVIGGHSDKTILPVLSADPKGKELKDKEFDEFIKAVQTGGTQVLEAKAGAGSAVLAPGYATSKFVHDILTGLSGKETITTAYIGSCVTDASYFSSPFKVGKDGIEEVLPLPKLSEEEECLLEEIVSLLCKEIKEGISLARENLAKC